jgi:hypothetical protein
MSRLRLLSILVLTAGLAVAISVGNSASASRNSITCKLEVKHGKRVVSCPKGALRGKHGRRGPRGARGPAGPAGPAGAAAGSGSGLNLNFNAYLTPNKARELTIGNFTITAASNGAGNCEPVRLRAGATDSRVAVGAGGEFIPVQNLTKIDLTNGKNSNMFTAISLNGASTMSGIVGAVSSEGVCLVSGYVTGL